jgi:hypothetical protein
MSVKTGSDTVVAGVPLEWANARRHPARVAEATDDLLPREIERIEENLAVLRRLGVSESTELPVSFVYESAGPEADTELAAFLMGETDYRVTIEPEGVSGITTPIVMSVERLASWVSAMLRAGAMNGGCAFGGWTVAVCRPD